MTDAELVALLRNFGGRTFNECADAIERLVAERDGFERLAYEGFALEGMLREAIARAEKAEAMLWNHGAAQRIEKLEAALEHLVGHEAAHALMEQGQ